MPTTGTMRRFRRCPRATVGAPDDDLFGQTIQPALGYIEYTSAAHSHAKETSQLGHEGAQWSRIMKCGHNFIHTLYCTQWPMGADRPWFSVHVVCQVSCPVLLGSLVSQSPPTPNVPIHPSPSMPPPRSKYTDCPSHQALERLYPSLP